MHGFTWKVQSKFTDPGAAGAVIDELPADLAALREMSSQLVFHYRADGDWAENGVPAERAGEINTLCRDLGHFPQPDADRNHPSLVSLRRSPLDGGASDSVTARTLTPNGCDKPDTRAPALMLGTAHAQLSLQMLSASPRH